MLSSPYYLGKMVALYPLKILGPASKYTLMEFWFFSAIYKKKNHIKKLVFQEKDLKELIIIKKHRKDLLGISEATQICRPSTKLCSAMD